jgi:hypothetical protein
MKTRETKLSVDIGRPEKETEESDVRYLLENVSHGYIILNILCKCYTIITGVLCL